MKTVATALASGLLILGVAGCGAGAGTADSDYSAKYKAAAEPVAHVASVDASYKSSGGMGRSGDVFLHSDSSDREVLVGVLRDALPAVVDAANGDPDVNLAIQVISANGASAVSPSDLGYSGPGTLSSYRAFLGK